MGEGFMYKLLIAEDELVVRKNIIKKIEWERYGFKVIGEAENGKEALDVIDDMKPDVIITDIEMPFMNGLELSSIVKKKYSTTKIVLLTGFDEFKYAQKAIELNVMEYVLKPVSADSLVKILEKIKSQLDKEIAQKKDVEALREHYLQSLPVMKVNFLNALIRAKQNESDILSRAEHLNLNIKGDSYLVSVISIDRNTVNETTFTEKDDELIKFAVLNTAEELVAKHSFGIAFIYDAYVIILGVYSKESERDIFSKTFKMLEELRQNIEKYMKFTVTIGIGNIYKEIENISTSFKSAVAALDYRFVLGNNRILFIEDMEPQQCTRIAFDGSKENNILTSIKVGREEDVSNAIEKLFSDITIKNTSFNDYQIYIIEILSAIIKVAKSLEIDTAAIFGEDYNLFTEMFNFNTLEDVKGWFKSVCIAIMKYISAKRANSCKLLVDDAREYINTNYMDNNISLNKVSAYLHISPSYFGAIFKNETGETFVNYLLRVRMENARDLICSTSLKNFQIAEKVGFSDQYYFSYCFKKYYKVSPNEFRNTLMKK
jgi:two-component system response regulator YesN